LNRKKAYFSPIMMNARKFTDGFVENRIW